MSKVIPKPPAELDLPKIAMMNVINQAHANGDALVVFSMATGKARSMTEAQFEAVVGFGGLFEEGEG